MILRRKSFTKYDETDALKRMKDSDILAEEKKRSPGYGKVVTSSLGGALLGSGIGATAGTLAGLRAKGARLATAAAKAKKLGKYGAIAGGLGLGLVALNRRSKDADEVNFYNRRLKYAQRQAMRRERADWKSNMTKRDGYSYDGAKPHKNIQQESYRDDFQDLI